MDSLGPKRNKKYDVRVSTRMAEESSANGSTDEIVKTREPALGVVGVTTTVDISVSKSGGKSLASMERL